jgi:hypothetical protein
MCFFSKNIFFQKKINRKMCFFALKKKRNMYVEFFFFNLFVFNVNLKNKIKLINK